MKISLLIVLFAATLATAEPPKVTPVPPPDADKWQRIEGAVVGEFFVLGAEPASKWRLETPGGSLRVFDNGKSGVFLFKTPAVYRVTVTGPGGDVSLLEIPAGVAPPGPGPGPGPNPVDPLVAKIKDAFTLDPEPNSAKKASLRKDLAGLYRSIAEKYCPDKKVGTPQELFDLARTSAANLFPEGKPLNGVRAVVGEELKVLLPILDAPLTESQRAAAADLFGRAAGVLEGL